MAVRLSHKDPSRTLSLQLSLMTLLRSRYTGARKSITARVFHSDFLGGNHRSEADKLRDWKVWFDALLRRTFPELESSGNWPEQVGDAYTRGVVRAFREIKPKGKTLHNFLLQLGASPEPITNAAPKYRGAYGRFVTEREHLMAERFRTELAGANQVFAQRAARSVSDALIRRLSPSALTRSLMNEVNIGRNRALMIARTEIVRAQAEGVLDAMSDLGYDEATLMVEWVMGASPCNLCSMHAGQTFTIEEMRGKIPLHPNCCCSPQPVQQGDGT